MESIDQHELAALRRDARRYEQLLAHPADARHLLTLLQTGHGTKVHLGGILDQMHLQDLARAGTLAASRVLQQGGADGRTGTERAAAVVLDARAQVRTAYADATAALADRILCDSLAVIDANRMRRAERADVPYIGPERRRSATEMDAGQRRAESGDA